MRLRRRDVAGELRRELSDPRRLAAALNLTRGAQPQRGGLLARCVWHDDNTASMSITVGGDGTARVHCFGCHKSGTALDLIAAVRGLDIESDFSAVLEEAAGIAGMHIDDDVRDEPAPYVAPAAPTCDPATFATVARVLAQLGRLDGSPYSHAATVYLERRGLLDEARAAGCFALPDSLDASRAVAKMLCDVLRPDAALADTDPGAEAEDAARDARGRELAIATGLVAATGRELNRPRHLVCFVFCDPAGVPTTIQRRAIGPGEPRYVFPYGLAPRFPYGIERLAEAPASAPIVLVEGAVDVLARRALDRRQGLERVVLGVPGVDGWRRPWADFAKGREAVIATDADEAGDAVVARWSADLFAAGAVEVTRVRPTVGKDWADVLARVAMEAA